MCSDNLVSLRDAVCVELKCVNKAVYLDFFDHKCVLPSSRSPANESMISTMFSI